MARIVVFGATGFIGTNLCETLSAQEHEVVAVTRRETHARHLWLLPTVEVVEFNVNGDVQALDALLTPTCVVVNLVGVLHSPSASRGEPYGRAFAKAHVEWPRELAAACARRGVSRLIHISALGADAQGPSEYQRSKAAGEAAIKEGTGIVPWTIIRPSVVFGPGDRFLNLFASLCQAVPIIPLGGAQARFQPVYVGDLVSVIVRCITASQAIGKTYEVAGPEVFTLQQLVEFAGACVGRKPTVIALSSPLAMLQAAVLECLPNAVMSRDNVRSMQRDNVASGAPLPFDMKATPVQAVVPTYIRGSQARSSYQAFRERASR